MHQLKHVIEIMPTTFTRHHVLNLQGRSHWMKHAQYFYIPTMNV